MKQIKLLGVIAVALTLGLTACNKPADGGKSDASVTTKHTHKYGDWTVTKEATCETDGSQERTCTICGEKDVKTIKAAHKWGEWTVVTPATCGAEGQEKRESDAGNTETRPIAKLKQHTWTATEVAASGEGVAYENIECSVCQAKGLRVATALATIEGTDKGGAPAGCIKL